MVTGKPPERKRTDYTEAGRKHEMPDAHRNDSRIADCRDRDAEKIITRSYAQARPEARQAERRARGKQQP
jgi:hypothetical protein